MDPNNDVYELHAQYTYRVFFASFSTLRFAAIVILLAEPAVVILSLKRYLVGFRLYLYLSLVASCFAHHYSVGPLPYAYALEA